jgi:hypothetical protein
VCTIEKVNLDYIRNEIKLNTNEEVGMIPYINYTNITVLTTVLKTAL